MEEKISLIDVCDFEGGNQPPKSDFIDTLQIGYVRMLQIRDFETDAKAVYINDNKKLKKCNYDDVLLARYGASVGKILTGKEGAYNVALMKAIPNEQKVLKRFIYYVLKSRQFQSFIKIISESRAAQAGFNKKDLSRFFFFLPDLIEQEKICAQLDAIQSLIEAREISIQAIDNLILSYYKSLFGDPIFNTKKWDKKKLSDLGNWKSGGTPQTNIAEYYSGNIPWFTSGELGATYIYDSIKHISEDAIKNSNAKIIPENSLLIGMYDTAAFKISINIKACSSNQAILYSKLYNDYYTLFVYFTLYLSKDFYLSKRKGARQKNLNANFIKKISIIYPSNKSDKALVDKFYSFFELHNNIKTLLNESSILIQILFQAVLQNAFKKNIAIDEEPLFKELIKRFTLDDLRGDKQRLQYLINLFQQEQLENLINYSDAREKLFSLMAEEEIIQVLDNDKITLKVK